MLGRKPIPTALKIARGNPRQKRAQARAGRQNARMTLAGPLVGSARRIGRDGLVVKAPSGSMLAPIGKGSGAKHLPCQRLDRLRINAFGWAIGGHYKAPVRLILGVDHVAVGLVELELA